MTTNPPGYMKRYRQRKGEKVPYHHIKVHTDESGVLRFNLFQYLRAVTSGSDYGFEGLPEGVTIDALETRIREGTYKII